MPNDRQITILTKDEDGKFKSFPNIPDELLNNIKQFIHDEINKEKEIEDVEDKAKG
tara:strand:+ start:1343 stop:1510 length:168 start_codon:yes stop_codon:yes gene_type:complete